MKEPNVLLVGIDFSTGTDVNVLTVGKKINGQVEFINVLTGKEAADIYKKLTTGEVADRLKKEAEKTE